MLETHNNNMVMQHFYRFFRRTFHAVDIPMPPHFPGSALLGLNVGAGQPTVVLLELSCSCSCSAIMWSGRWHSNYAQSRPRGPLHPHHHIYVVALQNSDPVITIMSHHSSDLEALFPTLLVSRFLWGLCRCSASCSNMSCALCSCTLQFHSLPKVLTKCWNLLTATVWMCEKTHILLQ